MARKNKTPAKENKPSTADYYKLNLKAVDDLINANEENSPKVSDEELRKYRSGPKIKVADWIWAVLIKVWFAGAVCFFFLWGLGVYVPDQLDQMLILGLALGTVTDILTNNLYRFMAKTPGANNRWMMFPEKKFVTLPLNILYAFLIIFFVVMTYNFINMGIMAVTGNHDTIPLGVEPVLFGVFTAMWDLTFIKIRKTVGSIITDAKKSAGKVGK